MGIKISYGLGPAALTAAYESGRGQARSKRLKELAELKLSYDRLAQDEAQSQRSLVGQVYGQNLSALQQALNRQQQRKLEQDKFQWQREAKLDDRDYNTDLKLQMADLAGQRFRAGQDATNARQSASDFDTNIRAYMDDLGQKVQERVKMGNPLPMRAVQEFQKLRSKLTSVHLDPSLSLDAKQRKAAEYVGRAFELVDAPHLPDPKGRQPTFAEEVSSVTHREAIRNPDTGELTGWMDSTKGMRGGVPHISKKFIPYKPDPRSNPQAARAEFAKRFVGKRDDAGEEYTPERLEQIFQAEQAFIRGQQQPVGPPQFGQQGPQAPMLAGPPPPGMTGFEPSGTQPPGPSPMAPPPQMVQQPSGLAAIAPQQDIGFRGEMLDTPPIRPKQGPAVAADRVAVLQEVARGLVTGQQPGNRVEALRKFKTVLRSESSDALRQLRPITINNPEVDAVVREEQKRRGQSDREPSIRAPKGTPQKHAAVLDKNLPRPRTPEEALATLEPGTRFRKPNGKIGVVPPR